MVKQPSAILGLKIKPTYDELLNTISEDKDKIKYPNRRASSLRRSFEYILNLMGLEIIKWRETISRKVLNWKENN